MSSFFDELDRRQREDRNRLFANRLENLHDYQGCANDPSMSASVQGEEPQEAGHQIRRLTELVAEAKELLDFSTIFSGGRDGDMCQWCRRTRPEWTEDWRNLIEDHHDAACAYLQWITKTAAVNESPKDTPKPEESQQ